MTSAVCRLKALRGKPKAKHIKSELLSAVVRTHHPRVVEAQQANAGVGTNPDKEKRPRRPDFSDALRKRGIEEVNTHWKARR
ncbi:hypothetical protein AU162_gp001 [Pseudomonas phage YMC11/02/R656]|uniref:Uncharacterized protein n=1 Tax=Pseudomonas phage YMC11/02/R656 TaxID=1755689 RepID=A0A0S2SY16_9CAUD|nr:hypothetical protein AU162_gp001 [Pseudomonas phage YMC11/02/R656]ALP47822.1 hypothetical protein BPPAER656_00010 [Pseudomonas phage YMC11/02/R656]